MPTTVQSVERAFAILETFDEEHPSRPAAEIAEIAGLTRPTTYRMLQTLQQLGYVRNVNGRFEVTPHVLRLGAGFLGRTSMAARCQPVLDELSEEVGEHVAMGTLDGDDVITLAASRSPQSRFLSIAVQVGQRLPARVTSIGRVLLAHRLDADDDESRTIREAGYVISDGLLESGLRSLGVPVRDRDGVVVAAISIALNSSRISLDELRTRCLPLLQHASDELTHRIGPNPDAVSSR